MRIGMVGAVALVALGGCREHVQIGAPLPGGARAVAMLRDAEGIAVGRATAIEVSGGLRFTIDVRGVPAGRHGARVDPAGRCDAGDHASAAAPSTEDGNLPTLIVGSDGRGTLGAIVPGATMAGLLDADGSAMVVRTGEDDPMMGAAGTVSPQIACGTFAAI